jgi:hypothetical protein
VLKEGLKGGYHMNCFIVDGGNWFVENVKVSDKLDQITDEKWITKA